MNRLTIDEFKESAKLPLIVVLDDVRSLYNVGSVFRTGDAFRIEAVYLCGITATPPHPEIHKTALGGEDSVDARYFHTAEGAVAELRAAFHLLDGIDKVAVADLHRNGYFVYAIEQVEGSTKLQDLTLPATKKPKTAVVFGNEVKGVHQTVVDLCDDCLEIPQFGTKHSLNVSVTAGIVIWEFARHFLSMVTYRQED